MRLQAAADAQRVWSGSPIHDRSALLDANRACPARALDISGFDDHG